jgi:hypothetical protein
MDDVATEELLRRPRRRFVRAVAVIAALLVSVVVGVTATRERTVYLMAPKSEMTISIEGKRARLPSEGILIARLRPGAHPIEVGGVTNARVEARISLLSTGRVFVPVSTDQCIVVASPAGLYELGSGHIQIVQLGKEGREVSAPFSTDDVVTDICSLPREKKIMSSLYVIQSAPCVDVPSHEAASAWLMARATTCGETSSP